MKFSWKGLFVASLTILSLYSAAPTFIYFSLPKDIRNDEEVFSKNVPSWLPDDHIKLGLDLQGGVQLVLGVDTTKAIESKLSRMSVEIVRWAQDNGFALESAYVPQGSDTISINTKEELDVGAFKAALKKEFAELEVMSRSNDGMTMHYGYNDKEMERIRKSALEQAERVVRNRVDKWGVAEPQISRRADDTISVQLPGFRDPERAKQLLGQTGQLKFQIVDEEFNGFNKIDDAKLPDGVTKGSNDAGQPAYFSEDRDSLAKFLSEYIPVDRKLHFQRTELGDGAGEIAKYRWTSFVLMPQVELDGDDVRDAFVGQGGGFDRAPVVSLILTGLGGKRFGEVTGANVNRHLAVVLDGVIESAPIIQQKILGGRAEIRLGGMRDYAKQIEEGNKLALVLKSGAIQADVKVLEQREVGATLGPELANQGIKGILVGLGLVLLFMLVYYRRPGVIACLALTLNAVFLLALMSGFGFALTLPGIASFILTLGMAVDANVLINERIRQEIREGKHPRKAVFVGFDKVFWTIVDANVTTLIAALVLLETTSSGPIKGFAVPLIIGLLVSLFTSLYCSRYLFEVALGRLPDSRLRQWLGVRENPKPASRFDFLRHGRLSMSVATLVAVAVIGVGVFRGLNWGVDFAGGTEAQIGFSTDVEASAIKAAAETAEVDDLSVQALEGGKRSYLIRYDESGAASNSGGAQKASASDTFIAFKNSIFENLKPYGPDIQQVMFVGPQVGKDLRNQGALSLLYAILAVILYIALRFDMRFAPGALIKMFLDVAIMLGFYVFFWRSFDLVSIAAFLTVIGYSVNDTIIIYDRIRENIVLQPRRSLIENINIAINETLGRSINTSLTTVASLIGIVIFGGGQIWDFAVALCVGIVVATISSIFVASTFVVWFERVISERQRKNGSSTSGGALSGVT